MVVVIILIFIIKYEANHWKGMQHLIKTLNQYLIFNVCMDRRARSFLFGS